MASGGTVASIAVSGAFFNPVTATAIFLFRGYSDATLLWIYWVGPFLGAFLAPLFFVFMAPHEFALVGYVWWCGVM